MARTGQRSDIEAPQTAGSRAGAVEQLEVRDQIGTGRCAVKLSPGWFGVREENGL